MEVQSHANPAAESPLDTDSRVALYRAMRTARVVEERIAALGEQGEVGFLPSGRGREAALMGPLAALRDGDWVFPGMHDWGAALYRGMSIATFVHRVFGNAVDPLKGRDMPGGLSARALHIASVSAPAGTHLPHAVGVAWAARQRGEGLTTVAFFDGGEVDSADFHTGLNFAGVMRAPTVFVCHVEGEQEGAAEHAIAYGLPHASCDGGDLMSVVRAMKDAVARADAGEGSTVIDVRIPSTDPVQAEREALESLGVWSEAQEAELTRATEEELSAAIEQAGRAGEPSLRSLFDDVFEALPPHLVRQRDEALGQS